MRVPPFLLLFMVLLFGGCATTENRYEYWYTIHELYADKTCEELKPYRADFENAYKQMKEKREIQEACGAVADIITALATGSAGSGSQSGPSPEETRLKDELDVIKDFMVAKQCQKIFAGVEKDETSRKRVEIKRVKEIETQLIREEKGPKIPGIRKKAIEEAAKLAEKRKKIGCKVK